MNKQVFSLFILTSVFLTVPIAAKIKPPLTVKTIVIDAGHGGKDPGSLGKKNKEKDITLAIALKVGKYIEERLPDVKVIYTRNTDVFVELQERAEIANRNKADLFISIHCNANPKKEPHGSETYVMGIKNEKGKVDVAKRENASILLEDNYLKKYDGFDPNSDEAYIIFSMYQGAYLDQSLNLSAKIQKQYKEKAGRADKGVKRASLWVLWRTAMPSLLTEVGFITNPDEEKFIGSEQGQDYIAGCIFRALREYKNEAEGKNLKYDDDLEKQAPYKPIKDTTEVNNEVDKTAQNESKKESIKKEPATVKDSVSNIKTNQSKEIIADTAKKNVKESALETDSKPQKENKTDNKNSIRLETDSVKTKANDSTKTAVKHKDIGKMYKNKIEKLKKDSVKTIDTLNSKTVYKVQIASGGKNISLNSEKFKNIDKIGEYEYNGTTKYTAGEFETEKEAIKLQNELRKKGFPDAFVVAFRNGNRVPLNK